MTVEKNDVDISRLFTWGRKFEIVNKDNEVVSTVYMKLLGDADLNITRVYALRKSQELRRKLRDVNSEERMLYVLDKDEMSKDQLTSYVISFSMRDINNRAFKEVQVPRPKPPKSDAKLEKSEKYQQEVDDYPKKLSEAVGKFIKGEVEKLKKALENESEDSLYKMYVTLVIDEYCEQEAFKAYKDYELYMGCFLDEDYTLRVWENFDKFNNMPASVKEDFRAAYDTLEIPMDELKKLREATQ